MLRTYKVGSFMFGTVPFAEQSFNLIRRFHGTKMDGRRRDRRDKAERGSKNADNNS
jgi:hypothetical protein